MGTMDEEAIGSSKQETMCGRASSKVFLSRTTEVCWEPNRAAVSAASVSSSSEKLEPYPTVYVRHDFPYKFIKASNRPESTPPLSRSPSGTSLSSCRFTDCLYSSHNSSVASLADLVGEKGTGL